MPRPKEPESEAIRVFSRAIDEAVELARIRTGIWMSRSKAVGYVLANAIKDDASKVEIEAMERLAEIIKRTQDKHGYSVYITFRNKGLSSVSIGDVNIELNEKNIKVFNLCCLSLGVNRIVYDCEKIDDEPGREDRVKVVDDYSGLTRNIDKTNKDVK